MSECEKCGEPLDSNGLCSTDRATLSTIWLSDSDICDECGGLIGDWGFCDTCGYDGVDWDEEDDTEDWWYPDDEDEEVYERALSNTTRNTGMA